MWGWRKVPLNLLSIIKLHIESCHLSVSNSRWLFEGLSTYPVLTLMCYAPSIDLIALAISLNPRRLHCHITRTHDGLADIVEAMAVVIVVDLFECFVLEASKVHLLVNTVDEFPVRFSDQVLDTDDTVSDRKHIKRTMR